MEEIRIGVIGLGRRARYLAAYVHDPEAGIRVTAGADPDETARKKLEQRFPGARATDDYRKMLETDEIDAVIVASPDYLHEEHAVAALEAGKTVYLEKPMATTIEGCDRILLTAVRTDGRLYLGHNMRHMDFTLRMKEHIEKGEIGEPKVVWCRHFIGYGGDAYFKDWHAEKEKVTSLLIHKGCHDIDIIHWLCDGYTRRVCAMGGLTLYHMVKDRRSEDDPPNVEWIEKHWPPLSQKGLNPIIEVEDVAMMLMELDNGVFASYMQCHYTPDSWRNYTVIGTRGRIENLGDYDSKAAICRWTQRTAFKPEGDTRDVIEHRQDSHGGADKRIMQEFVEYLRGKVTPSISPLAARNSVAAGYMATLSMRNGNVPYDVPPPPKEAVEYFTDKEKSA